MQEMFERSVLFWVNNQGGRRRIKCLFPSTITVTASPFNVSLLMLVELGIKICYEQKCLLR